MENKILGKDYENQTTMMKLTGLKTRQAIWYRIKKLKDAGISVNTWYDSGRSPCWDREDADKIINYGKPVEK